MSGPLPRPTALVRPAETAQELDAAGLAVLQAYEADGLADAEYRARLADARGRARGAQVAVALDPRRQVLGSVTYVAPGAPMAQLSRDGEAEVRMLGVHPGARGTGVGRALATWCLQQAAADGCTAVVLSSLVEMAAAHRLYARLGFVRVPARDWQPRPGVQLLVFRLEPVPAAGCAQTSRPT